MYNAKKAYEDYKKSKPDVLNGILKRIENLASRGSTRIVLRKVEELNFEQELSDLGFLTLCSEVDIAEDKGKLVIGWDLE